MAKETSTPAGLSQIKPTNLVGFHRALAKWYRAHGRHDLPWRNTEDPYKIWISEVMLQQTQVATVRERFYQPFLKKFPTVEALAKAERTEVMKAWEGLGYYRRAGNLHEAAKRISGSRFQVPALLTETWNPEPETLLSLPGIGRNTAHAILAFAYHQPVAILEANVKRVVARVFALEAPSDKQLWEGAETLLNKGDAFDYNQAMMDLGSMICTPKNPPCGACPAASICRGKAAPEHYPAPKARKKIPTREVVIEVREDARGRLFLEKRDAKLLGGLYGFPQVPGSGFQVSGRKKNASLLAGTWNLKPETYLGTVTHTYSHFKLVGHVMRVRIASKPNAPDWYDRDEIRALPLSTLDHKVLALVDNSHTLRKKRTKAAPQRTKH